MDTINIHWFILTDSQIANENRVRKNPYPIYWHMNQWTIHDQFFHLYISFLVMIVWSDIIRNCSLIFILSYVTRFRLKLFSYYTFSFFLLYVHVYWSFSLPSQLFYLIVNWKNVDREHFLFNRGVLQWHLCSLIHLVLFLYFLCCLSRDIYVYVSFLFILRINLVHEHTRTHF
jgi:hypothetical protein